MRSPSARGLSRAHEGPEIGTSSGASSIQSGHAVRPQQRCQAQGIHDAHPMGNPFVAVHVAARRVKSLGRSRLIPALVLSCLSLFMQKTGQTWILATSARTESSLKIQYASPLGPTPLFPARIPLRRHRGSGIELLETPPTWNFDYYYYCYYYKLHYASHAGCCKLVPHALGARLSLHRGH